MTTGAATVAVLLALALGVYWARWRQAESDSAGAKARAAAAGKVAWRGRRMILVVGFLLAMAVDVWVRGKGH
jgi:hypothetical protein